MKTEDLNFVKECVVGALDAKINEKKKRKTEEDQV